MNSIETFAGAGGTALGLHHAGFYPVIINEINKYACKTLRKNFSNYNIIEGSIEDIDFTKFVNIDLLSAGLNCQSFSYAGKEQGLKDPRGYLFFEIIRAMKECGPKVVMIENVKGLLTNNKGESLKSIVHALSDVGYRVEYKVLNANDFGVAQTRERLFIIAIRNDITKSFIWPIPYVYKPTLRDALENVPLSKGQTYSSEKFSFMEKIPAGGNWKNLSEEDKILYMKNSLHLGGGRTGFAKRLSWDKPCLTLTCSPSQKQTERCHPDFTRPLTIREYARVQDFPDHWEFCGSISAQYKQIGNAVPPRLAFVVGQSIANIINESNVI